MGTSDEPREMRCSVLGATVVKKFGKVEVEPISESAVNDHLATWVGAGWHLRSTEAVARPDVGTSVNAVDLYFFWER